MSIRRSLHERSWRRIRHRNYTATGRWRRRPTLDDWRRVHLSIYPLLRVRMTAIYPPIYLDRRSPKDRYLSTKSSRRVGLGQLVCGVRECAGSNGCFRIYYGVARQPLRWRGRRWRSDDLCVAGVGGEAIEAIEATRLPASAPGTRK